MAGSRTVKRREENEVEFSRIVAFSDGVFAIAITLLVLNLDVPDNLHGADLTDALWDQRHNLAAYALSFAVIGRFWVVHHRLFGEIVAFDGKLIALNLFYLAWIVLIPFSSQVLGDHGGDTAALVVYAANMGAVTLIGMWRTSDARREGLAKTPPHTADEARQRGALHLRGLPRVDSSGVRQLADHALPVAGPPDRCAESPLMAGSERTDGMG
jgi:uncharacterized membrane protein